MSRIAQKAAKSQAHKARQREAVVKLALRKGNTFTSRVYGEALSNIKGGNGSIIQKSDGSRCGTSLTSL